MLSEVLSQSRPDEVDAPENRKQITDRAHRIAKGVQSSVKLRGGNDRSLDIRFTPWVELRFCWRCLSSRFPRRCMAGPERLVDRADPPH